MKLIVGLGNPGDSYQYSRHNIGFLAVEALSAAYKIPLKREKKTSALTGKGKIGGRAVMLAMPLTYMNRSGSAVKFLIEEYGISSEDLIIVYDDLDLALGRIRIRPSGSSGGHRGLESVIDSLNSREFSRLRIGIGRPSGSANAASYVLKRFTGKQEREIKGAIQRSLECCRLWITGGVAECMNAFNKRKLDDVS